MTFDDILREYPHLTRSDLEAAARFASSVLSLTEGAEYEAV